MDAPSVPSVDIADLPQRGSWKRGSRAEVVSDTPDREGSADVDVGYERFNRDSGARQEGAVRSEYERVPLATEEPDEDYHSTDL